MDLTLHADLSFLAQRGRGVLRHPDEASPQAWRLPFGRRSPGRDQPVPGRNQQNQPKSQALHLDRRPGRHYHDLTDPGKAASVWGVKMLIDGKPHDQRFCYLDRSGKKSSDIQANNAKQAVAGSTKDGEAILSQPFEPTLARDALCRLESLSKHLRTIQLL